MAAYCIMHCACRTIQHASLPRQRAQVRGVLRELQQALQANKGYVLGRLTYADIVMAVSCSPPEWLCC